MANVSGFLQQLLNARYGKDVRQAIHDSISEINKQVEESDTSALASAQAAQTAATEAKNAVNNIGTTVDEHIKKQTNIVTDDNFGEKANAYLPKNELFKGVVQASPKWKNVTEYGIANDGITDVTEKLQALIDESVAGDVLYFPIGTYLVSSGLVINHKQLTLRGDNPCNWNYKYYNWSDRTKDRYVASVIKLADGISNVTMLTISGASTNSDVTLENLKFVSSSATWSAPETEVTDGTPHEVYNFTTINENVNGIYCDTKTLKNSQVSIINVSCSGFSGTACKLGNCGRTVGYVCMCSNIALETGIDNTIQYAYITMCNLAIKIGANCVFIYDTWIDLIRTYGIYSENYVSGNIVANLDHIGYAGIKVKCLNHMNIMARMNRCGGYYAGCSEDVITEYDKACLIYADNANNNVLNITCHALRNWNDSEEEGIMTSSPYGFCGTYWRNNNISIGSENKYGVYKQVSTDANYKIYKWYDNTFVVNGKQFLMDSNGLVGVKDDSIFPTKKYVDAFGGEIPDVCKGAFPREVAFTLAKETNTLKLYGNDNIYLHNLGIAESIEQNGVTVTHKQGVFTINGTTSAQLVIPIYGATETNESDITLTEDLQARCSFGTYQITFKAITADGDIAITEEPKTIPKGTVIYGFAIVLAKATYSNKKLAINMGKIYSVGSNYVLKDGTKYTTQIGSLLTYRDNQWAIDGNELSINLTNMLNDFFQIIFACEYPYLTTYYTGMSQLGYSYGSFA